MQRQCGLLLDVLKGYESHGGAAHCLADCLRVGSVSFVAFNVRFYELRRHQTHRMATGLQLASPVMCAAAGFDANKTRGQVREERHELLSAQLLAQYHLPLFVNTVDL